MRNNTKVLTEAQKETILEAVLQFAEGETETLLEDVELIYLMSLQHHLYDESAFRVEKSFSYRTIQNLVAVIDMVLNDKENCKQFAV